MIQKWRQAYRGMYFYYTLYEGVGKTLILVWQRGRGNLGQNGVTSFKNAPLVCIADLIE